MPYNPTPNRPLVPPVKGAAEVKPAGTPDMRRTSLAPGATGPAAPTYLNQTQPNQQAAVQNNWNQFAQNSLTNSQPSYQWGGYQNMPQYGMGSHMFDPSNPATSQQTIGQISAASNAVGMNNISGAPLGSHQWAPVPLGTPGSTQWLSENFAMAGVNNPNIPGAGGSGNSGGTGAGGGLGTVSSSITPSGVFNDGQTQRAINQSAADVFAATDPRMLQGQFGRPGRSLDAGTMAAAMPGITAGETAVGNAMASIPMQDFMANNQNLLQGQVAQGQETLGLANILRQLQQSQDYVSTNWQGALASMLGSLV